MKCWLKISLVLATFGFLKEFRPSEYFIFQYLTEPKWNITKEEINAYVFPVTTYSYLAQLVIVFLITDFCRYKPLIIILALSGVIVFSLLIWTTTLMTLQIMAFFYGTMLATEVAYYTYIYAKVSKENFQQVTGHARAGILIGKFLSSLTAQMLISFDLMNPMSLNYISLGALILGTIWSFLLPSVHETIYFHHSNTKLMSLKQKWSNAFKLLYNHFISSYSIPQVVKWSIWWSLSFCGLLLVQVYMQPLWNTIQNKKNDELYNGAVEAILTLFGTIGAIMAGFIKTDWKVKGEFTLGTCSIVEGSFLLIASQAENVFVAYACYVVFGALFHFMITIASAEIATNILKDSYGMVFGLNTFIALVIETIMIIIIVSDYGLGYAKYVRRQYLIYGGYFIVIGICFIIMGIFEWVKLCRHNNETSNEVDET